MTPDNQRALERLPELFTEGDLARIESAVCLRCESLEQAHAWTHLAARSPKLLEALEDAITAFRSMERLFGQAPWSAEAKIEAAETLLRETTRAMLGDEEQEIEQSDSSLSADCE